MKNPVKKINTVIASVSLNMAKTVESFTRFGWYQPKVPKRTK